MDSSTIEATDRQVIVCTAPATFRDYLRQQYLPPAYLISAIILGMLWGVLEYGLTIQILLITASLASIVVGFLFTIFYVFWHLSRHQRIVFDPHNRVLILEHFRIMRGFWPRPSQAEVVIPFEKMQGYSSFSGGAETPLYLETAKGQVAIGKHLTNLNLLYEALLRWNFKRMRRSRDPHWRATLGLLIGGVIAALIIWLAVWMQWI